MNDTKDTARIRYYDERDEREIIADKRADLRDSVRLIVEVLDESMRASGRTADLVWPIWRDCFANWGEFHAVAEHLRIGYSKALEIGQAICDALNKHRPRASIDDETLRSVAIHFAAALNPVFNSTRKNPFRVLQLLHGKYLNPYMPLLTEVCQEHKIPYIQGRRIQERIEKALRSIGAQMVAS